MILLTKDEAWPEEMNPKYMEWLSGSRYAKRPKVTRPLALTKFLLKLAETEWETDAPLTIKTKLRIHPDFVERLTDDDVYGLYDGKTFAHLEVEITEEVGLEIV